MNRRSFLRFLGIGAAAAVVAPEMVLDPERALWVPEAKKIFDLGEKPHLPALTSPFRIVLPDGTVWNFDGYVKKVATQAPVDGLFETTLEIQPSGPMTFEGTERTSPRSRVGALTAPVASHLSVNGGAPLELSEIQVPHIARNVFDVTDVGDDFARYEIGGLKRVGSVEMTISGAFEPDVLRTLFEHQPGTPEKPRRRR